MQVAADLETHQERLQRTKEMLLPKSNGKKKRKPRSKDVSNAGPRKGNSIELNVVGPSV